MKTGNLRFTSQTGPFGEDILALSEIQPLGAEIYTYQTVSPNNDFGRLWAGTDEAGRLAAVFLESPPARTLLTPGGGCVGKNADGMDFFGEIRPADRFTAMVKSAPARTFPAETVRIEDGARLRELLRLVHSEDAPHTAEARYVYARRAMNAGLSDAFGIAENGALCAVARIMAKNRSCALIGDVFTKEECRGRGYASRLLAACEAEAAAEGLVPVLYCYPNMARFYEARGYRSIYSDEL